VDRVSVEEPPGVTEAGLKVAVTPAGRPEADRFTVSVSPPIAVVVTVVADGLPWAAVPDDGLAETVKSGADAVVDTTVA
jgi:hypothetical protein